jgi:YbbR domain-containing protein
VTPFWPFRHLGLKALSIGIAVLLWMIIAGDQTVERGLRVPLELRQFPAGLELQSEPPALVDVRVRGSSDTLSRVNPGDIVAVLDLRGARPGRRLFQLTPEEVRAPFGVEVVQIAPSTLVFMFEPGAVKRVPIVPNVEGDPAPGYVLVGTPSADPATVEITGPESAVKQATEAVTEAVTIAGAVADVTENVTVGLLDPALRVKGARNATVHVQVRLGPRERTVRDRPVRLRDLPPNLAVQAIPTEVDVVIRGSREGLARVDPEQVVPFVDLKGLSAGEYSLTVHVDAFPDAGVARVAPETVHVRLTNIKE